MLGTFALPSVLQNYYSQFAWIETSGLLFISSRHASVCRYFFLHSVAIGLAARRLLPIFPRAVQTCRHLNGTSYITRALWPPKFWMQAEYIVFMGKKSAQTTQHQQCFSSVVLVGKRTSRCICGILTRRNACYLPMIYYFFITARSVILICCARYFQFYICSLVWTGTGEGGIEQIAERKRIYCMWVVSTSCQWPQNTYKNNNIIQNSFTHYIFARSMAGRDTCTREMLSFAHLNATGDRVAVCGVSYTIHTAMIFFSAILCRSIDIIDCIGYTGRRCLYECSSSASLHWNVQMTKKKKLAK